MYGESFNFYSLGKIILRLLDAAIVLSIYLIVLVLLLNYVTLQIL